jgi:hypothetical protein
MLPTYRLPARSTVDPSGKKRAGSMLMTRPLFDPPESPPQAAAKAALATKHIQIIPLVPMDSPLFSTTFIDSDVHYTRIAIAAMSMRQPVRGARKQLPGIGARRRLERRKNA